MIKIIFVLIVRRNKTALHYACTNGHSQIVAYLLNIGVNPDGRDSSDNTAIHYASAYDWYYCVKLLLEGGADANISNNWKVFDCKVEPYYKISIILIKQNHTIMKHISDGLLFVEMSAL